MLARWGARKEVIEAAAWINCSVCNSMVRPTSEPKITAANREGLQFNDRVLYDEFEVTLSDETKQQLARMVDFAGSFSIAVRYSCR